MDVGNRHRFLRGAGSLCGARQAYQASISLNRLAALLHLRHSRSARDGMSWPMVSAKGAYNRTKQAPTGGFHDGWQETNIYAGNCAGGCGPRGVRGVIHLDRGAAFGDLGVIVCMGSRTQAYRGICWAMAVWQSRPQGAGEIGLDAPRPGLSHA